MRGREKCRIHSTRFNGVLCPIFKVYMSRVSISPPSRWARKNGRGVAGFTPHLYTAGDIPLLLCRSGNGFAMILILRAGISVSMMLWNIRNDLLQCT